MGFTEVLTIIFIFLKVFKVVDWSWWIVWLPEIIMGCVYIVLIFVGIVLHRRSEKAFWNRHKKFEDKFLR